MGVFALAFALSYQGHTTGSIAQIRVFSRHMKILTKEPKEAVRKVLPNNVAWYFLCCTHAVPHDALIVG